MVSILDGLGLLAFISLGRADVGAAFLRGDARDGAGTGFWDLEMEFFASGVSGFFVTPFCELGVVRGSVLARFSAGVASLESRGLFVCLASVAFL